MGNAIRPLLKGFFSFVINTKAGVKDTVGCEPPFLVAFITTGLQFPIALWLREPTEQGFKPVAGGNRPPLFKRDIIH
jgi:hypothetical protein